MKICSNCGMYHIYKDAEEIYPGLSDIPIPHEKMPESVKKILFYLSLFLTISIHFINFELLHY